WPWAEDRGSFHRDIYTETAHPPLEAKVTPNRQLNNRHSFHRCKPKPQSRALRISLTIRWSNNSLPNQIVLGRNYKLITEFAKRIFCIEGLSIFSARGWRVPTEGMRSINGSHVEIYFL